MNLLTDYSVLIQGAFVLIAVIYIVGRAIIDTRDNTNK